MSNFVVKNGLVVNGSFTANSTTVNASSIATINVVAGNTTTTGQSIIGLSGSNSGVTASSNTGAAITAVSNTGYGLYVSSNSGPVAWFGQTSGITLNYLFIASNGNIGVGTSSPQYNLDVTANTRILGSIIANGGIMANGSLGSTGQVLTSNSGGIYWSNTGFANGANITVGKITASESSNTVGGGYSFTQDSSQDTGMFSSGDGVLDFYVNAVEKLTILPSGNVGIGNTTPDATLRVQGTANITGNVALSGSLTITNNTTNIGVLLNSVGQNVNVVSGGIATTPITLNALVNSILFYNSAATANCVVNITGNAGSSITANTVIGVGQSLTVVLLTLNGSTPYYVTGITIDGGSPTATYWQGGAAPTAGNASGIDAYTFTCLKTSATPTWIVLASLVQF